MKDYNIGGTYQNIAQVAIAALQGLAWAIGPKHWPVHQPRIWRS
ncbi:hypothetical protein [Yersinia alsatica]